MCKREPGTTNEVWSYQGKNYTYEPCAGAPSNVNFTIPRQFDGQIVERAFGTFSRHECGYIGDPYLRVRDQSDHSVRYYKLREETE